MPRIVEGVFFSNVAAVAPVIPKPANSKIKMNFFMAYFYHSGAGLTILPMARHGSLAGVRALAHGQQVALVEPGVAGFYQNRGLELVERALFELAHALLADAE